MPTRHATHLRHDRAGWPRRTRHTWRGRWGTSRPNYRGRPTRSGSTADRDGRNQLEAAFRSEKSPQNLLKPPPSQVGAIDRTTRGGNQGERRAGCCACATPIPLMHPNLPKNLPRNRPGLRPCLDQPAVPAGALGIELDLLDAPLEHRPPVPSPAAEAAGRVAVCQGYSLRPGCRQAVAAHQEQCNTK